MFIIFFCSRNREYLNIMNDIVIHNAIDVLKNTVSVKVEWIQENNHNEHLDGTLLIKTGKKVYPFILELKKDLRRIHLHQLVIQKEKHKNILLITEIVYPNIQDELKKRQINYLDTYGNIYIQQEELMLIIQGKKKIKQENKITGRALNKAGLKFIYYLFTKKNFLEKTYRQMAEICGTALGNINYIIKDLQQKDFLRKGPKNKYQVVHKDELLNLWVEYYKTKLKPATLLGVFRFQKPEQMKEWKAINITCPETQWGGEPAADILTNFLKPETFTLYTNENRTDLIRKLKLIPDKGGNISIYKKFWKELNNNYKTVHPILIYADLIALGDPRTDELANMIYDEYIKGKF